MTSPHGFDLISSTDLGGHGDCMHVNVVDAVAYVGHMGADRVGTSVVDVADPRKPKVLAQIHTPPGTHSHKVQVHDGIMLVNHERNPREQPQASQWSAGLAVYDVSRPADPRQIAFFPTPGKGVHRMTWHGGQFAYLSASDTGYTDQFLQIIDLSLPHRPVEVGRWWPEGMHAEGGEQPTWPAGRRCAHHHLLRDGTVGYATWWDSGVYLLDLQDESRPRQLGHLDLGTEDSGCTHTALPLPGRGLAVVVDEALGEAPPASPQRHVRIVDVSDPSQPSVVSRAPVPANTSGDPTGRFGPHNLHEMRPGSFTSDHLLHLTYFSGGLRVVDVSDPATPVEVASFVPDPPPGRPSIQLNDLFVDTDEKVYVTDRFSGGLYILDPTY
jgi:hypothetical protein